MLRGMNATNAQQFSDPYGHTSIVTTADREATVEACALPSNGGRLEVIVTLIDYPGTSGLPRVDIRRTRTIDAAAVLAARWVMGGAA